MSETQSTQIRVAIVGGGIGGLCTALALQKFAHLDVQIYEAAHAFSEIGAGVSFGPNAQRALRLIGPEAEAAYLKLATRNLDVDMAKVWFEFRAGNRGPREDQLLAAPWSENGQCSVHRAKFLDEFVKLVPSQNAHFGKRLSAVDEAQDGSLVINFKDGSTASADCIIGADGVHSVVRRRILGDGHPALDPVFTGTVAYRGLIPMDKAVAALGARRARNSFVLPGYGRNMMTYPVDFGATMNIVVSDATFKSWDGPWVQPARFADIKETFKDFGAHGQQIISLLDNADTKAWALWDHPAAPTYFNGRTVMLGDAAHASTPFQGQGAGQAIEDAFVLSSVLGLVRDRRDVEHAFRAYDAIRRPRSQSVVRTSRESGELNCFRLPGVMDDAALFKENMTWRMDWMWHRDVGGECDEAAMLYEAFRRGETVTPMF